MSGSCLPWLGVPLQHGPWVAAFAAFAATPGGPWLLALVLERRLMGLRTGFAAACWRHHGEAVVAVHPTYYMV